VTDQLSLIPAERPRATVGRKPLSSLTLTNSQEPSPAMRRSVEWLGVLQPVLIRPRPAGNHLPGTWLVIDGNRRCRAARAAQLDDVPTIEVESEGAVSEVLQLTANNTRGRNLAADLASVEALAVAGYTPKEIGHAVGLTSAQVDRLLRMSNLHPTLRAALDADKLALGIAEGASRLPTAIQQLLADQFTAAGKLKGEDVVQARTARTAAATAKLGLTGFLDTVPELPEQEDRVEMILTVRQALSAVDNGQIHDARHILTALLTSLERA
jgi:ParB/RepB/Spo0J family partition protein